MARPYRALTALLISLVLMLSGIASTFKAPLPCVSRGCSMPCCQPIEQPKASCCASKSSAAAVSEAPNPKPGCGACGCIAPPAPEPSKAAFAQAAELPHLPLLWVSEAQPHVCGPLHVEGRSPAPTDARGPPGSPDVALPQLRAPPVA